MSPNPTALTTLYCTALHSVLPLSLHRFYSIPSPHQAMLQDDILCLVFSHPCLKRFLFEPRTKSTGMQDVLRAVPSPGGRTIFTVRYRCLCEIIASGGTEGIITYRAVSIVFRAVLCCAMLSCGLLTNSYCCPLRQDTWTHL